VINACTEYQRLNLWKPELYEAWLVANSWQLWPQERHRLLDQGTKVFTLLYQNGKRLNEQVAKAVAATNLVVKSMAPLNESTAQDMQGAVMQ
jgi:hypothetical protein